MTFSELPVSIKKEFLSIKDETTDFDNLVKSLIKHNKRVFFGLYDSTYYFYDNDRWYDVEKEGYNDFTYKKINEYGKFETLRCTFGQNDSLYEWLLKRNLEIYFAKDYESNEYYLLVDDYDFEIDVKKNTFKTKRNPKFYLVNEENMSDIKRYINKVKYFEPFAEDLGFTNSKSQMIKSIILDIYLDIKKGDKRAKSLIKYNLTNTILLKSDLTTAYSLFDNDGNLKVPEWLFDCKCNSIKKIKKYQTWIKKYKLNKDDLLAIDYFLSTVPDKYVTKINSIVSKKDDHGKNFYDLKELIDYIKNQMLTNFLPLEEIIDSFHNSVIKQIKKYNTIKNKFPENIVSYSNFLNRIFYCEEPKGCPNCILDKDNLKLLCIEYTSDYLLRISELLQQDIFLYSRTFKKNIYVVSNNNEILKIFDVTVDNKKIDRVFYEYGENVDEFINEAFSMNLFKN